MDYEIGYRVSSGSGVFRKKFKTDKEFRSWLDKQFPDNQSEYKLIGIIKR